MGAIEGAGGRVSFSFSLLAIFLSLLELFGGRTV